MMDEATSFFFTVLVLQAVFTGAVVLLVKRRFPRRLSVYRFVAPAALPLLLTVLVGFAYITALRQAGAPITPVTLVPLARFLLAYAVLWLVGVLFATLLIRVRRR